MQGMYCGCCYPTELKWALPSVQEPVEEEEEEEVVDSYEEPKLSWAGVRQLISMVSQCRFVHFDVAVCM